MLPSVYHDVFIMREDLRRLYEWATDWHMLFKEDKCFLMHMGKGNKKFQYNVGGVTLRASEEERDLGVIMHSSAKPSRQCVEAAKRANRILGMIKRTIVSREQDVALRLYKSLVRPHLEYCVQAWSPYLRQDIDTLEQIQRRATKMIRGLGKITYEERLMRCGVTNLEKRITRGDLIEANKIMTEKEAISAHKFFEVSMESKTRGHGYKLYKKRTGIR